MQNIICNSKLQYFQIKNMKGCEILHVYLKDY